MTDAIPEIIAAFDQETQAPVAIVDEDIHADMGALLAALPALSTPGAATELARIYTHFARPLTYEVIDDPADFEKRFQDRLGSEDPSQPWQQGVFRLCDIGVPNFKEIASPANAGGTLRFFAEDKMTGMVYASNGPAQDPGAATFAPVAVTPVPMPPAPEPDDNAASDGLAEPDWPSQLVPDGEIAAQQNESGFPEPSPTSQTPLPEN